MCNDYRSRVAAGMIRDEFSQLRIPLRFPQGTPNLQPRDSIKITDTGAIIRASPEAAGEAELVSRRWSWPGPGGKPVYNFRSDGREFGEGRCLVVTDGFYEFTEPKPIDGAPKKRLKDKWLFTMRDHEWFCIAGLWRSTSEVGEAFTMLTTMPGPDVAPYHSRQVVVLGRDDWARWLDPRVSAKDVLGPARAGTLTVEQVR